MSAISSGLYPPSNRRRCVKGRPSYTEPSDLLFSSSINHDHDNDSFGQNEYNNFMDPIESDDIEEEPITIDLSAFLNENPLLAQSAFESSAENNVPSTESSSQFRVTDCEIKSSSEILKPDVVDELCSVDVGVVNAGNDIVPNENLVNPVLIDSLTTLHDNAKENCLSPENLLTNISSEPIKDITLNGKKSPIKKFCRTRPLGLSNPLKKYKNFIKSKDLNKANEKVFGKYPIVKCEKLDIENFVKNNKIKVRNWPLLRTENQKNSKQIINRNVNKKFSLNLTKNSIKPKFMRKPISFNKYLTNSNKKSAQSNIKSILVDTSVSKPIVIKTDSWKPGITNSSSVPGLFRNLVTTSSLNSKATVYDLLKLNDQTVTYNAFCSEKETEKRKKPSFASINKIFNSTKSYPLIAPKPAIYSPDIVTLSSNFPKPTVETLIEPLSNEYTVIEPYVDDPSSPQKPKPILTVPVEVISSPEKHSSVAVKVENSEKLGNTVKSTKSVFLNGAIRQISIPSKIRKNASVRESVTAKKKFNRENILHSRTTDVSAAIKGKHESSEESSSVLKAKNAVVDAMQSAFSSVHSKKKKPKPQITKKSQFSLITDLIEPISSYSSILNDNILHGFSENDFEDLSFSAEDESNISIPNILTPPRESLYNKVKNKKNKRKKFSSENSLFSSDTLSASEGENNICTDGENVGTVISTKRRQRKKCEDTSANMKSLSLQEDSKKLDTSLSNSSNTVHSEVFNNAENNKVFDLKNVDLSLSFSGLKNHVSNSHDVKDDVFLSPETIKQPEIPNTFVSETLNDNIENPHLNKKIKVCEKSLKQETCTRTLRERKCSSTEVDKFSDLSVKQISPNRNTFEKAKIKGSINSKLKIQMKTPPRSTAKVKIKRKSCKPEDIIREINTITGGHQVSEKAPKKHEKSDSEKNTKNSDFSDTNSKNDSESNSSLSYECSQQTRHSFSKKKRTLKVRIKRSKKKNGTSCLKMQLNSFTDVIENANSTSSISENNINVHSSFREGKVSNMGTPHKEENTTENSTSISDCNMEVKKDEQSIYAEHLPANEDPMVNSSEASLLQDDSIVKPDLNNSMSDSSFFNESQNNEIISNDTVNEDANKIESKASIMKSDEEKRNISSENISDSSDYVKCPENLLNKTSSMPLEAFSSVSDENPESTVPVDESKDNECAPVEEILGADFVVAQNIPVSIDTNVPTVEENMKDLTKKNNNENNSSVVETNTAEKDDIDMNPEEAGILKSPEDEILKSPEEDEILTLPEEDDILKSPEEEEILKSPEEDDILKSPEEDEILKSPEEDEILKSLEESVPLTFEEVMEDKVDTNHHSSNDEIIQLPSAEVLGKSASEFVEVPMENETTDDANIVCDDASKTEVTGKSSDSSELPIIETPERSVLECTEKEIAVVAEKNNDFNKLQSDTWETINVDQDSHLTCSVSPNVKHKLPSTEKNFTGESRKSRRKQKSKKCPKIKISFIKSPGDSPDSLKSWFVSESKKSHASTSLDHKETLTTSPESDDSILKFSPDSDTKTNSSVLLNIREKDSALVSSGDKELSTTVETSNHSFSDNDMTDNKIDSKDVSPDKSIISLDESILPPSEIPPSVVLTAEKDNSILIENSSPSFNEISLSDSSVNLGCLDSSIKIKEEPMDVDENPETNSIEQSVKATFVVRKRGRPRKSDNRSKSSEENILNNIRIRNTEIKVKEEKIDSEEINTKEGKTTLEEIKVKEKKIKLEEINTPMKIKNPETPHSRGRKKKSSLGSTSIPGVRKKNYDPELVRLPFSAGWMREHVIRAAGKDGKRQSDIYYFGPDGKKLRSMPEISSYLHAHPDIKFTVANFTFAKELVHREPFEIERDARQTLKTTSPIKKTPAKPLPASKKKTVSSEGKVKKNCVTPTSLSDDIKEDQSLSDSMSSNSKKIVKKHKRSSSKEITVLKAENKTNSLTDTENSKSPKQKTLDNYFNNENDQSEKKHFRPSRKIVKKVPFDNSFENMFLKMPKQAAKRNSGGMIKINIKSESNKNNLSVTKPHSESNVLNDVKAKKESELPESQLPNSSSSVVTNSNELPVDKSLTTSSPATITNDSLFERTNIKSPKVKNKLKVKFATRKSELSLHNPCNKYCNFAQIRQPSIKCCICLCLFHPECVPFRPTGLTKYACVPCVKTRIDSIEERISEISFPPDFDVELLYPHIDLQITSDPAFDASFNKFYSPVDPSFVHSRVDDVHTSGTQVYHKINPHSIPTYNLMDNTNFNLVNHYPIRQQSNMHVPLSFNASNMHHKGFQVIATTVPFQRTQSNNSYVNVANSGSLPLLQNFSNSFFIQNQPCNKTLSNQQISFQNSFPPIPRYNNALVNPATNMQNPILVQKLIKYPQSNEFLTDKVFIVSKSCSNVQDVPRSATNDSLLQTILQTRNASCDNSRVCNFSTDTVQKNNLSVERSPKKMKLNDSSRQENNNIANELITSASATVSEVISCFQTLSPLQDDSNDRNKRTDSSHDASNRKSPKVLKQDELTRNKSSPEKSSAHKTGDLDRFSSFWNINKFSQIYECLNLIFKHLNVSDLLSASLVCRSWNHLVGQKLLWEHACFSGAFVKNWEKCFRTLDKYGTRCIDFRGLHNQDSLSEWEAFVKHLSHLSEVEELIFEKVPPFVINAIADNLPQLKKLICYCVTSVFTEPEIWSTPCKFELSTLRCLGRLEVLKISSMGGIHLNKCHRSLMPYLPKLTHLVLTGFKFSCFMNLECLSQQKELISLELGDCGDIEPQIYGLLEKLTNLETLCLQNGGNVNDAKLPEALSKMSKLKVLELMNFQVSCHLPGVLKKMDTLLHFSIWPDNTSPKAAQVNFNSFSSATSCTGLKSLCWGILKNDDDETVPNALELEDSIEGIIKKLSFEEIFQSLVKSHPGGKVDVKCLPRSMLSEYCSSRSFV